MTSHSKPTTAALPADGYVRQSKLIPAVIPVSASTWWRWIREGKAPEPVKLSARITAWRVEDIRAFLTEHGSSKP